MILDETVVGMWYLSLEIPIDIISTLLQFEDHFEIDIQIREHDAAGKVLRVRNTRYGKALVPLSEAIQRMRDHMSQLGSVHKVCAEWEVLRGARSTEEFGELLASMPNAFAHEATPEEVAEIEKELQLRGKR